MKNFDSWNVQKQEIHFSGKEKLYHARDIWWCSLGINIGFEQDGTGDEYQRPVLIVRGFSKQVCLIIPLTTSQKINRYHFDVGIIDGKVASAILSQLRLIDTKRLINKIGVLDKIRFLAIKKAITAML